MKRSMDQDDNQGAGKRYRGGGDASCRLLISSRAAGSVIGRGGANISRLRQENSASITIPDTMGPERVVNLGCDNASACSIVTDLLPNLDDSTTRDPDAPNGEVKFLVHGSQAGGIIGKGGSKIKELREETGTQIRVFSEACPQSTDRVVLVSGAKASVVTCLGKILDLLEGSPPKGMVCPYDPNNYDESFAAEYGGFVDGRGGGGPGMGRGGFGGPRGGMGGRGGGFGGMGGRGGMGSPRGGFMSRGGGRGGMGGGMGQLPGPGGMDFSAPAGGGGGMLASLAQAGGAQGAPESQQFSLPKNAVGAIIGKGGARIRQTRMESGAQINIDDGKDGGDRVVTITGNAEQVRMAHFLLQKCVRENNQQNGGY